MPSDRGTGKRDFDELERRRIQAAELLKQGLPQAEVARRLKVSRESVRRWANRIEAASGLGLRKAGQAGRKPKLGPVELKRLKSILKAGPAKSGFHGGAWNLKRVASVIHKKFNVRYHTRHVSWILRKKLDVFLKDLSDG
jgi:putative transposase